MDASKIKELYQQVILKHNKAPVRYEKWEDAPIVIEAYNPLCGDRFTLYLNIENERVQTVRFHGYGCAISKAATSVLVKKIEGAALEEVLALCEHYAALLDPEIPKPAEVDPELAAFIGARQFPARLACANLSWEHLRAYLTKNQIKDIIY